MQEFCDWLASTGLSQLFANASWFVPSVQTIHILAIGLVVAMLAIMNVRLLRRTASGPPGDVLAASYIPWIWRSLVVLLITGALLIITEPVRELMNNAFRTKMLLVLLLVILTLIQRSMLRRNPNFNALGGAGRLIGAAVSVTSILLCVAIVAAGRLIAYV
jgi:cobalamin synthase